ncbi:MAG TPA: hypothetical protein VHC67_03140 [Gaiellaceae bacterium]|jgi:hypothetical protein|nr:hypothetical protein [Gaiellaceae bacterium]
MAQTSGTLSGLFNSPRKQRRFFIFSGLILAAGIVAILVTLLRGTGNAYPDKFSNQPAQVSHPDKKAPVSPDQISLMRKFIKTAVARNDLKSSYWIVGPDLRGGLTQKQWQSGTIPVLFYHADNADSVQFKTDYSYQKQALFEVNLHAKPGTETRPSLLFFIGLKRQGDKANGRWLVNYFEPNWRPPLPMNPG